MDQAAGKHAGLLHPAAPATGANALEWHIRQNRCFPSTSKYDSAAGVQIIALKAENGDFRSTAV